MVKLKLTDDVTQGCRSKIFDRRNRIFNSVSIKLRIGYLIENDRVNLHRNVILGNNRLRREIHDLFLEGNIPGNSLKKRNFKVYTRLPRHSVCAETLNNISSRLGNNFYVCDYQCNNK